MPIRPNLDEQEKRLFGRIPLIVGVSGHRDLDIADEPRLRDEVARVFEQLKEDYLGDDTQTPIVLLSALAEGADSLVAEVALEHGAILIAPLPMEEAEYREDFKPGAALRENAEERLTSLLACALAKIEMPYRDGSSQALVRRDEGKRAEQYQDVGLYVVEHCHVLLALWNGDPNEQTGGSSQNVRFKRDGIPFELSNDARTALDGSEIGPVIEIMTPRKKAGSRQVAIETKPWGFGLTGAPLRGMRRIVRDSVDFARIFFGHHPAGDQPDPPRRTWNIFRATTNQTRRFNREAAALGASEAGRETLENSLAGLFTDYTQHPKPKHFAATQSAAVTAAGRWCGIYQRADALALIRQTEFKRDWFRLFMAGFFAVACFEAYAHLHDWPLLMVFYILTLCYAFFLFSRARLKHHQERFLDYRALAEALRVAVYWKTACIGQHVADAYPIKQPSELAWVKIAVRTLDMLEDALGAPPASDDRALDDVRQLWLVGQQSYFTGKSSQLNLHAEKREEWSLAALGTSLLVGAAGLVAMCFIIYDPHKIMSFLIHGAEDMHHFKDYMIAAMGLLVGLGAVIAGYTEQLAFKAQGRQYERMSLVFGRALLLVDRALAATPPDVAQVKELYLELGREAMKENAEWVAIYRQRPIRPAG